MKPNILPLAAQPVVIYSNPFEMTESEKEYLVNLPQRHGIGNVVSVSANVADNIPYLKANLQNMLDKYVKDVVELENKFVITNTWVARTQKGQKHELHVHPNSIFSGVFYIQTGSGALELYPEPQYSKTFDFVYDTKEYNIFNAKSWKIPVRAGDLVLFPSNIWHSVEENEYDEDRIIVGFNSFVKGKLGMEERYTEVII